jgi:hypothetical protein
MADMQALAAAITAAIQAATAAAAPPPNFAADLQTAVTNAINAAQQQVLPPGAFSLHPATVSAAPIDYSTSTGDKLYRAATEQLQDDVLYSLDDPDNNLLIEISRRERPLPVGNQSFMLPINTSWSPMALF